MPDGFDPEHVRSLATIGRGETVVIGCILFDLLRSRCADLGLREGDVVSCSTATPAQLLLEKADGQHVALKRDWARFIQVTRRAATRPARSRRAAGEATTA